MTEQIRPSGEVNAHLADPSDAHDASAVSVLDTAGNFTGTEVETVLDELFDSIAAGGIPATIFDAKGDLIAASAADTAARLAAAANGAALITQSGASTGLKWRLNNDAASAAPTVNDDSGDGYEIGSRWLDTTNDREYVLTDATVAAAVWVDTTAPAGAATLSYEASCLTSDVTITPANSFVTGPGVTIGEGTWLISAYATAGRAATTLNQYTACLSNGTDFIAETSASHPSQNPHYVNLALHAIRVVTAGMAPDTIELLVAGTQTGVLKAEAPSNSQVADKATCITAIMIAP